MKKMITAFKMAYGYLFCFPHLIAFYLSKNKKIIAADILRWLPILNQTYNVPAGLIYLLSHYPEYRNPCYFRVGPAKYVLSILCPKMSSLKVNAQEVGEGLYIQHGETTRIGAKSVGKNCWINQQVTIGWEQKGRPVIKDNERIGAGAKIIGDVVVGNNVIIGANAVIVKSVPDNCTVVGVYPAYIVRRNGQKVKEIL